MCVPQSAWIFSRLLKPTRQFFDKFITSASKLPRSFISGNPSKMPVKCQYKFLTRLIFLFRGSSCYLLMHQSIPAVPIPPRALAGHLLTFQSRGWGIWNFITARGSGICLPGGRAFAYPRDDPGAFETLVRFWSHACSRLKTEGGSTFLVTAIEPWNLLGADVKKEVTVKSFRRALHQKFLINQQFLPHF